VLFLKDLAVIRVREAAELAITLSATACRRRRNIRCVEVDFARRGMRSADQLWKYELTLEERCGEPPFNSL